MSVIGFLNKVVLCNYMIGADEWQESRGKFDGRNRTEFTVWKARGRSTCFGQGLQAADIVLVEGSVAVGGCSEMVLGEPV